MGATFLVGLMGIPMECPMCLQGTRDVLSGQGMLKANLDMSAQYRLRSRPNTGSIPVPNMQWYAGSIPIPYIGVHMAGSIPVPYSAKCFTYCILFNALPV